jgi:membrane associated rhomboid family serine protease
MSHPPASVRRAVRAVAAAGARGRRVLTASPVTLSVAMVTGVVGAAQLFGGGVVASLERNRQLLEAGQWWRLVTPMFVQPDGVGQYAFNLIGGVVVGVALERQASRGRWLTIYFGAGLVANIASYLWFPTQDGGGSSDGVAGLIGALTLLWWITRRPPWWPAYFYAAFFAAYLTGLATGGVIVSTLSGALSVAVITTLRRHGPATRLRVVISVLVLGCAVVLTLLRDDHGVGLLAGMAIMLSGSLRAGRADRVGR